jgi:hypothetical protein
MLSSCIPCNVADFPFDGLVTGSTSPVMVHVAPGLQEQGWVIWASLHIATSLFLSSRRIWLWLLILTLR